MAINLPVLPDNLRNGPSEVGIAAGVDTCNIPELALVRSQDPLLRGLLSAVNISRSFSAAFRAERDGDHFKLVLMLYYVAGASYLVTGRDNENVSDASQPITQEHVDEMAAQLVQIETKFSTSKAFLVLMATKVNWWQTNHHVGQVAVQGFVKKCLCFVLSIAPDSVISEDLKRYVWAVGHTISTRLTLTVLGVKGINISDIDGQVVNDATEFTPRPTEDIRLRLHSGVAGCMKILDAVAVFRLVGSSIYADTVIAPFDAPTLLREYNAIMANMSRYHIGALYLTGEPRVIPAPISETVFELASALIHGAYPNSTLAANKTLPAAEIVRSNQTYLMCAALRQALARKDMAKALVQQVKGRMGQEAHLIAFGQAPKGNAALLLGAPESYGPSNALVPIANRRDRRALEFEAGQDEASAEGGSGSDDDGTGGYGASSDGDDGGEDGDDDDAGGQSGQFQGTRMEGVEDTDAGASSSQMPVETPVSRPDKRRRIEASARSTGSVKPMSARRTRSRRRYQK